MSQKSNINHRFNCEEAAAIASEHFGVAGDVQPLNSYIDQNFLITEKSGRRYVLKIMHAAEPHAAVDAQNKMLAFLASHAPDLAIPRVCPAKSGDASISVVGANGGTHLVRLLTYLPGAFLAEVQPRSPALLESLGRFLGKMDKALIDFHHPAAHRELSWDLQQAARLGRDTALIENPARRRIVAYFLLQFENEVLPLLPELRRSVIHNDANDYNVLVDGTPPRISGIIDFGDMVHTCTVCELAIALAYVILGTEEPLAAAAHVVAGYHQELPLAPAELEVLHWLCCARLCMSVIHSARKKKTDPANAYAGISETPAWRALGKLIKINPLHARETYRHACGLEKPSPEKTKDALLAARGRHIGPSLRLSYRNPLHIVRGALQYLFSADGRTYLDAVNNVPHVGHSHPRVVRAVQQQTAVLNTNTRYLYEQLTAYAARLSATLPDPLSVCYIVNSGSEANELALRLARAHTGGSDFIVIDGAYHGNTGGLIDISPYKFNGPGGAGAPAHVHVVPTPDGYRGPHKSGDPAAGEKYAASVETELRDLAKQGRAPAAFICEPLMGCAGQIVFPEGYLQAAYAHVRERGAVCIADEVQIGFGRVGSHFWGFETQGVVPDIVTLGKPIGNGFPLGAVVTTPEIAASFDNGMEYFNTYGGNPVACAAGMAVLDVIREEKLQENAREVGDYLKGKLAALKEAHPLIGDVRGRGLFLGVELVRDHETLEPAGREAAALVERMQERGILLSTDGPFRNVIKIKPPLVFTKENADLLVQTLDKVLASLDSLAFAQKERSSGDAAGLAYS